MRYFTIFNTEIENQLDRKIKVVRFDRGREYYGGYDGSGHNSIPFARFLEQYGIIAQYSLSSTPQ